MAITNQLNLLLSRLKSSILKQAFQGKLVALDPNDEPVEILLEKIRKEKQKIIKDGKTRRVSNVK